jgi:hypothetical protein
MKLDTIAGDLPCGGWRYSAWRPAHLAWAVDHVWQFEGPTAHRRKRIFPNGMLELLVNFVEPYRFVAERGRLPAVSLTGMQSGPLLIDQPAHQSVLGVRLRPLGAYALLGRPLRELSGLVVALDEPLGRAADELAGRAADAVSVEARFQRVAEWLSVRLAHGRRGEEAITWAAMRIEASGGGVPIAELRARTGLSKARLAGTFRDQIGLTPKLYARLVLFRRVLAVVQNGDPRLSEVALATGL